MKTSIASNLRLFVIISANKTNQSVIESIKNISKDFGLKIIFQDGLVKGRIPVIETITSEIARCDLVIADITNQEPNTLYEIGLAHAMGKFVAFIVEENYAQMPFNFESGLVIPYNYSSSGLDTLRKRISLFINEFIKSPRRFRPFLTFPIKYAQPPYIIDLEKLESREFENLSFELIAQMGFKRVEWGKEFRDIDVVATLPKKDPDGYEYQELWLIAMGRRAPLEMLLEMALVEPEHFLMRLLRSPENLEELFSRYKIRNDVSVTLLFISQREGPQQDYFENRFRKYDKRLKDRSFPFSVRVRLWDQLNLTNLIQQYPQIAFKYFSEESRIKSEYRKTPQEMYDENVMLNERIQITLANLEEEKKKRFIAERNAAWKDVAFKAAHKLGNPIDAIDTFLESLKKRISTPELQEALNIANNMEVAVEESKTVVEQFKSLIKAQEINPKFIDLGQIIHQSLLIAREQGVEVIEKDFEKCPEMYLDPFRMSECFNELVANSLHWLDKVEKRIFISISRPSKKELPPVLEISTTYLKVSFGDNGLGVQLENKEKIFAPFFTTYAHGTGLGLSLVKTIIEGHGGYIFENGKPNEGANFEIYLQIKKNRRK